jgi:hypothetical protein
MAICSDFVHLPNSLYNNHISERSFISEEYHLLGYDAV